MTKSIVAKMDELQYRTEVLKHLIVTDFHPSFERYVEIGNTMLEMQKISSELTKEIMSHAKTSLDLPPK